MSAKYKFHLLIWAIFLSLVMQSTSENEMSSTAESLSTTDDESSFRLPTSLNPLHYLIRLQPFVNGNFSIHGYTEITFEVVQPTSDIILHIRDILTKNETLKIYSLSDVNQINLRVSNQTYDKDREFYHISLSDSLKDGQKYVMQIEFVGFLNNNVKGFYRSQYMDPEENKRWLALTNFQPTYARMAFPCFDEPAMKAEFSIELIREEGMSSISNMPRVETTPITNQNGWVVDKFEKSFKMSTYLVAFVISDFKYVNSSNPDDTVTLRAWSREVAINQTDYDLQKGREAVRFLEDFFNISFPMPKLDIVAIPHFYNEIRQSWGLIIYNEFDPNRPSLNGKNEVGHRFAYAMVCQWLGNLVTPSWWSDFLVNEGFAIYLATLKHDAAEPTLNIIEKFLVDRLRRALVPRASPPISIPVTDPQKIEELSNNAGLSSNPKAASVIRMMRHFLTENTFKKGITNFLNEFAFSNAKQDDLWYHLTLQAEADQTLPPNVTVKEIMDTWTLQTDFPIINVTLHGNGTATLTQEKSLVPKSVNSTNNHDYKWWVPITFTTQSNPNFSMTYPQQWMKPSEATKMILGMPLSHEWVVFNLLQTGLYRVNYELENWNKLIQQLNKNNSVINAMNRVQIIGDAFQLVKAGLLPYSIPLGLISYLDKEDQYEPLFIVVHEMGDVVIKLSYTNHFNSLRNFLLPLFSSHYEQYTSEDSVEDFSVNKSKQSLVTTAVSYFGYNVCIDKDLRLYREWMMSPINESIIDIRMRATVYCNAIKGGGNEEWDFAWNQYLKYLDLSSQINSIMFGLSCTRNNTRKLHLIKLAFQPDGPIKKQDLVTIFTIMIRNGEISLMALNYLRENWDKNYKYLGNKEQSLELLALATNHIQTYEELAEIDAFVASKKELQEPETWSLGERRKKIVANIKWYEKNLEVVVQWLKENGFEGKEVDALV